MQRVAGLLLGYSELLGLTRNYSDLLEPSKTACRNDCRGVYLHFYQITAQDGPIVALTYSELLGLTLTRSAPQARESRRACGAVLSVLTGAGEGVVLGRVLRAGAVP